MLGMFYIQVQVIVLRLFRGHVIFQVQDQISALVYTVPMKDQGTCGNRDYFAGCGLHTHTTALNFCPCDCSDFFFWDYTLSSFLGVCHLHF